MKLFPLCDKEEFALRIPIEGPPTAGSRISLAALRVLGVPLNELIELRVFVN